MKRVVKGRATAFTCLGNWYDLADRESCADLLETLATVNSRDKNTALAEIVDHAQTLLEDSGAPTTIHVSQQRLRKNKQFGICQPPLTVTTGRNTKLAHEAAILDQYGATVANVVYRPDNPLRTGATVWIEALTGVRLREHK